MPWILKKGNGTYAQAFHGCQHCSLAGRGKKWRPKRRSTLDLMQRHACPRCSGEKACRSCSHSGPSP